MSFLFNYKLAHVLVAAVTLVLVAANLAPGTSAMGADKIQGTVLSQLIVSEFEQLNEDEGQLIVETFAGEAVVGPAEQSYLDNLSAFRPQPKASYGPEEDDSPGLPTMNEGSSLVKPELAETVKTKRPRTGVVEYVVLPGDTISTIAQEFEVSVNTILWENNKTAYNLIRPGDKLAILPMTGVSHLVKKGETLGAIAKKYEVGEPEIMEANKLAEGQALAIGAKLIIPGGRQYVEPVRQVKSYTGFSAIKDIVSAPNAAPAAGNKMNWPTSGGRITQRYSVRHYAVDIANKVGTPIYAADAGTVELAGWGSGYGNQIVIDHGGGKKTRYAHLSKFNVKKGDTVSKGQVVGGMGSTGWSTGSHLHFEVIIGGRKQNPLNYIK
jgi:LysM repeat protein